MKTKTFIPLLVLGILLMIGNTWIVYHLIMQRHDIIWSIRKLVYLGMFIGFVWCIIVFLFCIAVMDMRQQYRSQFNSKHHD